MAEQRPPTSPKLLVKTPIDGRAGLTSAIRTWLTLRDQLLWHFSSGTESEDRLERLDLEGLDSIVEQLNWMRNLAIQLATQLAEAEHTSTDDVLNDVIDGLLVAETPKFLLSAPGIPGSF